MIAHPFTAREATPSNPERQDARDAGDANEQVQDLPTTPIDAEKAEQVKGGAEPISEVKFGTRTRLPSEPVNG
jgi:hypothetical protein